MTTIDLGYKTASNAGSQNPTSLNGKDLGITGNGTTDDTAALQAALTAANTSGIGILDLPAGLIKLSSATPVIPSGVWMRGAGEGRTEFFQAYWPNDVAGFSVNGAPLFSAAGSLGSTLACSSVTQGTSVITGISSTATLAAGNFILLASQDYYWSGYNTRYKGEILRVQSVDSGTQVTVSGLTRDTYSTSPTVQKMTMVSNIRLSDFSVRNSDPASTHATVMFGFKACANVRIRNVTLRNSDQSGFKLNNCYDVTVDDCSMYDFTDVSANSQLGYGILAELATELLKVNNSKFVKMRHAFTTGGITPSTGGGPHNITITGCLASEMTETAFDTHQIGTGVAFIGNQAEKCKNAAFTSRSLDTKFIGNSATYCKTGFVVYGDSGGIGHGTVIQDNVVRNIWGDYGVRIYDPDRVTIKGNTFDALDDAGVYVSDNATRLTITRNEFINCGINNGSVRNGIEFATGLTGTGHRIEYNSFRNESTGPTGEVRTGPGHMDYAVKNASVGVTGSIFAFNTATGLGVGLISDVGGNLDVQNQQLDGTLTAPIAHATAHQVGGADALVLSGGHTVSTRVESIPRYAATGNLTLTSGTIIFGYFTPSNTLAATNILIGAGSTASATVTLARLGLYSVDGSGNLALIQGTTSDTALLGSTNALYTKAITSASVTRGTRYAIGVLVVGTTAGSVRGSSNTAGIATLSPTMSSALTGQTDLPGSVAVGTLAVTGNIAWFALT